MADKTELFHGTLVHSTRQQPMVLLTNTSVLVTDGKIADIICDKDVNTARTKYNVREECVHILGAREFLMPGLVDTHIHAPQYVYAGTGLDLPLLEWLDKYTYPTEAKFKNVQYASARYQQAVARLIKNGTTCACYYATIHREASVRLAEIVGNTGQRAFIGKVNMNQNAPDYYVEETEESYQETVKFVDEVLAMNNPLVQPVITPRFAPSTDMELMKQLAKIANTYNIPIQSHLSENVSEVEWVKSLFPECDTYSDVYDEAGLLGSRTIMAHCVHISTDEMALLKERQCGVSHCPNSNLSLTSGLCDVRRLLNAGVKVGLGTDCAGGYNPSILDAIRMGAATSKAIKIGTNEPYQVLNHRDLFYLATLGGSQVLGIDNKIGNFEVGKEFDALRIAPEVADSPFDVFDSDTLDDVIQKFLYLGDDRNIASVYVSGKQIKPLP